MTAMTYNALALSWTPERSSDKKFNLLALSVLVVLLLASGLMSLVDVPKPDRTIRAAVPERVAQFIMQKEKPKPKVEQPKPKPKPVPKIKKIQKEKPEVKKPLTKKEVTARKKAESSGLLALNNELADLMDTTAIDAMVGGKISKSSSAAKKQVSSLNTQQLTAGAGEGSGGISSDKYTRSISSTRLTNREKLQIRQTLVSSSGVDKSKTARSAGSDIRAEEDITIVFDQNKSKLYSIYNRERRKNPGLKGKIVLEITIAPSGKVTSVKIISSELNSSSLEQRLLSRIKMFNFGVKKVETIKVTYPIEFLPS